jgi:hypothetical protein
MGGTSIVIVGFMPGGVDIVWAMVWVLSGAVRLEEKGWCLVTKPMSVPRGSKVWIECGLTFGGYVW